MTASVPPKPGDEPLKEPSFPVVYVTDLLKAFVKAMRAHQLYLANNPMHARSLETVKQAFAELWKHSDKLELQIAETQLKWEGRVVLEEGDRTSDNLSWLFYKDGIRELTFLEGFENEDLSSLFDLMQRVRKAAVEDDDLLTMMWEREFNTLRYKYVDLLVEAGPGVESMERSEQKEKILSPAEAEAGPAGSNPVTQKGDFDSALYFLDETEVEYLQGEIKREFSTDVRPAVIASLLDTFETQKDPTVREEICGLLDPRKKHRVKSVGGSMETNADWSPYEGWDLAGFSRTTLSRGEVIVDDYRVVGKEGRGQWLPRKTAGLA